MYKFNNNTIVTGYIKQLLSSFNLPSYYYLKPGIIFPNTFYFYNKDLYKSKSKDIKSWKGKAISGEVDPSDSSFTDMFEKIAGSAILNSEYLNITKNLLLKNNFYDLYTHRYLGNYLRFLRDFYNVDLMTLYNCFDNSIASNLDISDNNFKSSDTNFVIYEFPVMFDKYYAIGIDCDTSIEIAVGLYDNDHPIAYSKDSDSNPIYLLPNTYLKTTGSRFNKPFIYDKLKGYNFEQSRDAQNKISNLKEHLTLFIKVPLSTKSSISVIELSNDNLIDKNTLKNSSNIFTDNADIIPGFDKVVGNEKGIFETNNLDTLLIPISKLQLFRLNDKISYPFADRLLEYLFDEAICPISHIRENIYNFKKILYNSQKTNLGKDDIESLKEKDIWDNYFVYSLYKYQKNNKLVNKYMDITSYIDKETDYLISGGNR